MAWLRLYDDIIDDPKMDHLSEAQRWLWVTVLCLANRSPIRGRLLLVTDDSHSVPLPLRTLVKKSGMTLPEVEVTLSLFEGLKMMHRDKGVWCVSNWDKRQFTSDISTERTRRHRAKNVDEPAQGTAHGRSAEPKPNVPEAETEAETDLKNNTTDVREAEKSLLPSEQIARQCEGYTRTAMLNATDWQTIQEWIGDGAIATDAATALQEGLEAFRERHPGKTHPDRLSWYTGFIAAARARRKAAGVTPPPSAAAPLPRKQRDLVAEALEKRARVEAERQAAQEGQPRDGPASTDPAA